MLLTGGLKQLFSDNENNELLNKEANQNLLYEYEGLRTSKIKGNGGDVGSLIDYYKEADSAAIQFVKDVEAGNIKIKEGETASEAFERTYSSGIKSLASGLKNLGKTILSTLGKAALSAGISWLVTEGISAAIKGIGWLWDEILTDNAERQRRSEAVTSLGDNVKVADENIKAVDDAIKEYDELYKKIKEGNLTLNEEIQCRSDLSKLQESLNDKFGDAAEGLDLVNKGYDSQIKALQELRKEQARAFLYDSKNGALTYKEGRTDFQRNLDVINATVGDSNNRTKLATSMYSLNEAMGFDVVGLLKNYSKLSVYTNNPGGKGLMSYYLKLDPDMTKKEADEYLTQLYEYLDKEFPDNPAVQKFKKTLQQGLNTEYNSSEYNSAIENTKETVRNILAYNSSDGEDILTKLERATNDYNLALSMYERDNTEENKKNFEEAKQNLDEISKTANTIMTDTESYDHRMLSSTDGALDQYSKMVSDIISKRDSDASGRILSLFEEQGRYDILGKLKGELEKLTDEEKIELEVGIDDDAKVITFEELDRLIDEAKERVANKPIDLKVGVKSSDAVDSMADMKTAIGSLNELWNQTVEKQSDSDTLFGFADPATLNSIESSFSKYISGITDEKVKEKLSYALEEFEDTMVRLPQEISDVDQRSEAYRNAINQLIDSYLDQTDAIKNLTEENKDWTVALLEDWGITNALEVVESRLVKTNKKLIQGVTGLADAFKQYGDALKSGNKNVKGFDEGIEGISKALGDMFAYMGEGGQEIIPEFDTDFIIANLELIGKAAEGDVDALNELRTVASQEIVAKMNISGLTEEVDGIRATIMNDLNGIQGWIDDNQLEVGASLNDAPMIQGLNNLVRAGKITRDEMNAALSAIGVVPYINDYIDVPISTFNGDTSAALDAMGISDSNARTQAGRALQSGNISTVRVPSFGYKVGKSIVGSNYSTNTSKSNNPGGGPGSSSNSNKLSEDTKETYDWIEVKLKRLEEAYQRLDKTAGAVYESWTDRNQAVNDGLEITKEQLDAAVKAAKRYEKERDSFTVTKPNEKDYEGNKEQYEYDLKQFKEYENKKDEYKRKVENGQLLNIQDDIEYKSNKYIKEYIDGITQWNDKAIAQWDSVRDIRDQYFNGYKTLFDNIKTQYDSILQGFEDTSTQIEERISRSEEHGYFVSQEYYKKQILLENDANTRRKNELQELIDARNRAVAEGAMKLGDEAYTQMTADIRAKNLEIEKSATTILQIYNKMRDNQWSVFDYALDRLNLITDEAEFLIDMLDQHELTDDNGYFNERGWTSAGLMATEYDVYMQKSKEYAKELTDIEKQLAEEKEKNGAVDKKLIERREELLKLQQDSIKAAEQEKEAIKDLVQNAINKHLEALSKLIERYKTSLSDAKSLYEYQKSISQQTENITSLQKQLQAYAGDDSEEARATIQKLQKSLEDAEQGLKETEWDKYISETGELLDKMYEDYSETLNDRLDNIDTLMEDMIGWINQKGDLINTTINDVSKQYGYEVSKETQSILSGNGDIVSSFNTDFNNKMAEALDVVKEIKDGIYAMAYGKEAKNIVDSEGTGKISNGKWHKTKDGRWWYENNDGSYAYNETITIDGKKYKFDKNGYLKGYATGSSKIPSNQLAWTQENGSEFIFRKSDGAMLTPLNKGDMVFTKDMSENLWNMAKNPALTGMGVMLPTGNIARTVNQDNDITIVLPNVQNYDEFKSALQKDPKFTNFIQATTLGQSLGKGKLNRGNF